MLLLFAVCIDSHVPMKLYFCPSAVPRRWFGGRGGGGSGEGVMLELFSVRFMSSPFHYLCKEQKDIFHNQPTQFHQTTGVYSFKMCWGKDIEYILTPTHLKPIIADSVTEM